MKSTLKKDLSVNKWVWEKIISGSFSKFFVFLRETLQHRNSETKFIKDYLETLEYTLSESAPLGIPSAIIHTPIRLEDIYIRTELSYHRNLQLELSENNINQNLNYPQSLSIGSVLRRYRKVGIIGDPGSGKSVLVNWLVLTYARSFKASLGFRRKNKLVYQRLGINENLLPIIVRVRSITSKAFLSPKRLTEFVINPNLTDKIPSDFFEKWLSDGKCFVVVDGLDEASNLFEKNAIVGSFQDFVAAYPKNRYLVTSRIVGYSEAPLGSGFYTFTIRPFERHLIREYLKRWFTVIEVGHNPDNKSTSEIKASETASKLFHVVESNDALFDLAQNPLLLTIISTLYWAGIQLPERKAELYIQVLAWFKNPRS